MYKGVILTGQTRLLFGSVRIKIITTSGRFVKQKISERCGASHAEIGVWIQAPLVFAPPRHVVRDRIASSRCEGPGV